MPPDENSKAITAAHQAGMALGAALIREATVFDSPVFMVVCPQCKVATKLDDALERDEIADPSGAYTTIKVICPHCKLEATL